ncbi:MAG TPA: hypothetical protein VKZ57_05360 [Sphingobacterium sp.]|nr:hypothetical protein [Sphingobacterium sp.]
MKGMYYFIKVYAHVDKTKSNNIDPKTADKNTALYKHKTQLYNINQQTPFFVLYIPYTKVMLRNIPSKKLKLIIKTGKFT